MFVPYNFNKNEIFYPLQCPVSIVLNENDVLEHFGHTVTRKDYYKHAQNRRLDEGEKAYLKELMSTNASARNIAQCLSQKTGREYNCQDVQNLTRKLSEKDEEAPSVEAILGNIQDNGGNVTYSRDENNCRCFDDTNT